MPAPVSIVSSASSWLRTPVSLETVTRSSPPSVSTVVRPSIVFTRTTSAPPPVRSTVRPRIVVSIVNVSTPAPSWMYSASKSV